MDRAALRQQVLTLLTDIAPELDAATLKSDRPLRLQVDLDSFDWLNFLVALNRELQVAIPESDYRQLDTLDHLLEYLQQRLA